MTHIKMVTQIADWALAYTVRDIFGTAKDEYLENKNRFWNLFSFIRKEFIEKLPVSMLLFHSKLACRVSGDSLTSELWVQSSVLVEMMSLTCT